MAVLEQYLALSDTSLEKRRMELRYGKSTLQKLVKDYEDEQAFHKWLTERTGTPCPGCDLRVEKHSGCNHVRLSDYLCVPP